jgi:SAM-dependent methyltransferase
MNPEPTPAPEEALTEHARRNRAVWDAWSVDYFAPGRRAWARSEPDWGIWDVPEREIRAVPNVDGKDVLELGCGTAYWSAWLARRGARVVGLDNSPKQLANARRFQQEFGLEFPLIHASAEAVPLPEASVDLILSEYGACLWCDPYRWVPEAARLLRPGGRLIFLTNGVLLSLCTPPEGTAAEERLARDYFGMHRFEWPDDDSVEFHLPHGEWIRLLRRNGFTIEALIEIQAPEGATTRFDFVLADWARRWPSEEIWKARRE